MTRVAGISNGFLKGTTVTGGGTSGTGKNYLAAITTSNGTNTGNGDFEDGSTTGWSLGNVSSLTNGFPSLGSSPTFGSGASANLSIGVVSSGQLAGSYSGSYASSAATVAGDFLASDAFYIDNSDKHSPMTFSFNYLVESGTVNLSGTSSNSFGVAIWDVTNSAWIQPAGCFGMDGSGYCTGTFQTSANSTQYRLVLYNANATSGAFNLYVDSFTVGPQTTSIGPAMSDWQSYDLVIGATTTAPTLGTTTVNQAMWRRVGDSMEIRYQLNQTAAGTAGSGNYLFPLPSGYSMDTTKISFNLDSAVGYARIDQGSTNQSLGVVHAYNATNLYLVSDQPGTTTLNIVGSSFYQLSVATTNYYFYAKVPIVGWSSNTVQSSDTDTRVVDFVGAVSTGQAVTANVTDVNLTASKDSHGAWNGSQYIVPVSGDYVVGSSISTNGTGIDIIIFVNGSEYALISYSTTGLNPPGSMIVPNLKSGDIISLRLSGSVTTSPNTTLKTFIHRLSGPAAVQASESVNCSYSDTSGASIGTSAAIYKFQTKRFDSHNAYSTSTGLFTVPVSGKYRISAKISTASVNLISGEGLNLYVYKNGSIYSELAQIQGAGISSIYRVWGSDTIECLTGDTLAIYVLISVSTTTSTAGASQSNQLSINRIGN